MNQTISGTPAPFLYRPEGSDAFLMTPHSRVSDSKSS